MLCVIAGTLSVGRAQAQSRDARTELRGGVRDSVTGAPIAGAVVQLFDATGASVARTVTSGAGQFRLPRPTAAVQLQAMHLGFRPVTVPIPDAATAFDLRLAVMPRTLAAIDVAADQGCPVRLDRSEALAMLDQARAGLLAAVVAAERTPTRLQVLRYERRLDLDGVAIESQTVRLDSSRTARTSFDAVQSARDFVQRGFRTGRSGDYTYFGPDAEVLLDAAFQRGYCFSLADPAALPDSSRHGQVGLHFTPASRRRDRVDIDGTLWIDTAQRVLHDLEFTYVGVEPLAAGFNAGGFVRFRTLAAGVPFIEAWALRLVGAADTVVTAAGISTQSYAIREIGGVLAAAEWRDADRWEAPLGRLAVSATTPQGEAASGVTLRLAGTDYQARTDSLGYTTFTQLLPGPYPLMVDDPRLQALGVLIPTGQRVVARSGGTVARSITVPSAEGFVAAGCSTMDVQPDRSWLLGRVVTPTGFPAVGVSWRLRRLEDGVWTTVADGGITGSDGVIRVCRGLITGHAIEWSAWRDRSQVVRVAHVVSDRLTALRLTVPDAVVASRTARGTSAGSSVQLLTGTVRDSVTGVAVPDARVRLLDTPYEGATDATGTFVIGGVARGRYLAEVGTPWLDSIGAVARVAVTIDDSTRPVSLYTPALSELLEATCGTATVSGVLVGQLATPGGIPIPPGLRVVGGWRSGGDATNGEVTSGEATSGDASTWRVRGQVDPGGTFRLCGIPTDSAITLQLESDQLVPMGARPTTTRVPGARRFARVDLPLDSMLVTVPFVSRVVATAGTSLPTVSVLASGAPVAFEERRRLGIGRFMTAEDFAPMGGRRLSDALANRSGFSAVQGRGDHGWVISRRAPNHILPKGGLGQNADGKPIECGVSSGKGGPCMFGMDDFREQGFYCPTNAEVSRGIECGCYAQVYLDDRLMNGGRPTEPFDINTIPVGEIAGVEFYATAAQTPGRYSQLNAKCGVMLVWTKRGP